MPKPIFPEELKPLNDSYTLNEAYTIFKAGKISKEAWAKYRHLWQTSAPRFSLRACDCEECLKNFPSPEYEPFNPYSP